MKILQWVIIALIFFGLGWFAYQYRAQIPFLNSMSPSEEEALSADEEENGTVCAQVITPAVNPETGEIKEFPTPCDVPAGWELIENEVPGLDLQLE